MLLVCNGAQKSGSTWLFNILVSLVKCQSPDQKFLTKNSSHPCIKSGLLEEYLESEDYISNDYITKNHLSNPRFCDLLLSNNDIFVFDIERDPKDVVVSLYYDECNRHGYKKSFKTFYWTVGREEVVELSSYHSQWRGRGPRSYVASYERLQSDFAAEVRAIADVLGIDLSDDRINTIQYETSIEKLRDKYSGQTLYQGKRFFRKGIVGDWKEHFDKSMLKDVERIVKDGFGSLDWRHAIYLGRNRLKWQFGK